MPTLELIVTNTKRKAVFNNGEIIVVGGGGGGGGIFVVRVIVDCLLVKDGVSKYNTYTVFVNVLLVIRVTIMLKIKVSAVPYLVYILCSYRLCWCCFCTRLFPCIIGRFIRAGSIRAGSCFGSCIDILVR